MKIKQIQHIIEQKSPLELQESWDNSGFQIRFGHSDIETILVAVEVTASVIREAQRSGAGLIVTHHPMFFNPIKKIDDNDVTGNYAAELIKSGISVYATHTPFDRCEGGNNDYLAELLKLNDIQPMDTDESGYCRIGNAPSVMSAAEYISELCEALDIDKSHVSFAGNLQHRVIKVGLCTGSGTDFLEAAAEAGCDLFVTGDVRYHAAQQARELGLNLLDIGHYGSEKIFVPNMTGYLRENTDVKVIASKEDLNPFTVLI